MTDQPQQQEYIITECQIKRYHLDSYIVPDDLQITAADEIRSRPAPIPEHNELAERECAINNCFRKDWMQRHDTTVAAQAREEELQRAIGIINSGKSALYEIMPDGHWTPILQAKFDVLLWVEESLRSKQEREAMTIQIIPIRLMVRCPQCSELSDADLVESKDCYRCDYNIYLFANECHCNYPERVKK